MKDAIGDVLANQRVKAVLPHVRGRLLDLGCGENRLVRRYVNGVGIDVHPWPGADILVRDSASLHWDSASFDTITIVAALNHMPDREAVLRECRRLLRPDGRLVITALTPRLSRLWHWLRGERDDDQRERGMQPGEVFGFTHREMIALLTGSGFVLESRRRFMLGLNHLYVFRMAEAVELAGAPAQTPRPLAGATLSES